MELNLLNQDEFYEPDAEVMPDDHVVGELSEDSIRLYTVWRLTEKTCSEKMIEARFGRLSSDRRNQLLTQVQEMRGKTELLSNLFWLEIKDDHKLWDKPNIGIREGRKVVWYEDKGPRILGIGFGDLG